MAQRWYNKNQDLPNVETLIPVVDLVFASEHHPPLTLKQRAYAWENRGLDDLDLYRESRNALNEPSPGRWRHTVLLLEWDKRYPGKNIWHHARTETKALQLGIQTTAQFVIGKLGSWGSEIVYDPAFEFILHLHGGAQLEEEIDTRQMALLADRRTAKYAKCQDL